MRSRTLLSQVLAVNTVLVAITAFVAALIARNPADEVRRLSADFNRMLERLEHERRESGRAVLRAQEVERSRIAQDLHDEVNQALTAILLRLSATISDAPPALQEELRETQQLATQAMEELLTLARQLRPTALDDHGLVPALASQVSDFGERARISASRACASARCSSGAA